MSLVLDKNNLNKVKDRTDLLIDIPNNVGVTNQLGLFTDSFSTQKKIEIAREKATSHILTDRNWDERNNTIAGRARSTLDLKVPHFPADDAIYPHDLDGVVAVASAREAMDLEQVGEVRAQKMMDLMDAHAITKEAARMQLITAGTVYAPNGTLATSYGPTVNFYTEFGVSKVTVAVPLSAASDPRAKVEEAARAVRTGVRSAAGGLRGIVTLCSTSFFNAIWMNAYVTDAVKYFQQGQSLSILTGRPDAAAGFDANFRTLTLWGVTFIDAGTAGYEDKTGAFVPFIAEGTAQMLPVGVRDMFKTYYAPANKFSTINTKSKGSYWFETATDDCIKIETEQNFLNAVLYPQAIVGLTFS